jgi:hypothetical protein
VSRLGWFAAGAAVSAAAAALWGVAQPLSGDDALARWRARALESERRIAELRAQLGARDEAPARGAAVGATAAAGPAPSSAPAAPGDAGVAEDPLDPALWEALVGGALEREAERRGRALGPEQRRALLDALAEVRRTAEPLDAEADPERERMRQSTRLAAVLRADLLVRESLGVGLSELVRGLDDGAAEEVSPVASPVSPSP